MSEAPFISTFIAIALIPVAFLFTHAYFSGKRKLPCHKLTGITGIVWDLSMSVFYMLYRVIEGQAEGGILDSHPELIAYFAIHGIIAAIVILLELGILSTGVWQWRKRSPSAWHRKLSTPLYILWFAAFLSGEVVYLVYYVL
jgi:uncharacterized membrane protein YozB (DUF420 family)